MSAARFETTERQAAVTQIDRRSLVSQDAGCAFEYQFRATLDTEAGLAVAALKSSYVTGG
jgi:hypothetical protein